MTAPASPAAASGPIADTSYRHYAGPLRSHRLAWLVIARHGFAVSLRKRAYWVLSLFAFFPYALAMFQLYLRSQAPAEMSAMLLSRPYASYLYDSYAMNQFWIFLLALVVGSASIAGDNATNALQVYLARPLSRFDYLIGKWLGIFWALAVASLAPSAALLIYMIASFQEQGLLKQNPWLILQALGTPLVPAAVHASLILGFSSFFRRPVLAGGYYAGFYFGLMVLARAILPLMLRRTPYEEQISTVSHIHVAGVVHGLGQQIYNTLPTLFGIPPPQRAGVEILMPELWAMLLLFGLFLLAPPLVAAGRIRAVEIVRG